GSCIAPLGVHIEECTFDLVDGVFDGESSTDKATPAQAYGAKTVHIANRRHQFLEIAVRIIGCTVFDSGLAGGVLADQVRQWGGNHRKACCLVLENFNGDNVAGYYVQLERVERHGSQG